MGNTEMRKKYIDAMGPELGHVMAVLHEKLVELHVVWQQYRQLFGTDEETVHLVNRTAGLFFQLVQDVLWDHVLLGISRMTDPAESRQGKNLTLNSIAPLLPHGDFRTRIEELCLEAKGSAEFAREHRNKRIAHHDHAHATGLAEPLSGVSRAKVEEMLMALRDVLNAVDHHYRDTTVLYEDFIDDSGARVLASKLRRLEYLQSQVTAPGSRPLLLEFPQWQG